MAVGVFDSAGTALGSVSSRGIWHPAPGDPDAPAGPGLIENQTHGNVVAWMTSQPDADFVQRLLNTMDTSLRRIEPDDSAHGSIASRSPRSGSPS